MNRKDIYNRSILLIGPVGSGKSLIANELSKTVNMPVLNVDLLRHSPKEIIEIESKKRKIEKEITDLQFKIKSCQDKRNENHYEDSLNKYKNELWVLSRQIEMRQLLPNLSNYEELGFNSAVSTFIRDKFGILAWHFYQKQFENKLLEQIVFQIDRPYIIDLGGGMAVSLDDEYAEFDKTFRALNEKEYLENFDLNKISFKYIKNILNPFKNIIALTLPKDYKDTMKKAGNDLLNEYFIKSRQYEKISKYRVDSTGLIKGNSLDKNKLLEIVTIIKSIQTSSIHNSKSIIKNDVTQNQ